MSLALGEQELEYEQFLGGLIRGGLQATLTFLAQQARLAYRYFSTQKYGCFCGAGSACATPVDNLDRCCQQHDRDYTAARVNTTPGVDMWTPLGFRRSRTADLALVSCAARTRFDPHWYGPAAAAYREALILIFRTRADIARALESTPSCIKDNGTVPVWDVSRLLAGCP